MNDLIVVKYGKLVYRQIGEEEKLELEEGKEYLKHKAYFQKLMEVAFQYVEGRFIYMIEKDAKSLALVIEKKDAHKAFVVTEKLFQEFPDEIYNILEDEIEGCVHLEIIDSLFQIKNKFLR